MKEYDVIAIGSVSTMDLPSAMMQSNLSIRVAVIDKDEPSCGQAYITSEGKFCSCSEMYRILARILGRKRACGQHSKAARKRVGVSSSSGGDCAGRLGFYVGPEDRGCVTSDRAYRIGKARNELQYFPARAPGDDLRETVE
jgi:hypothetical protein